MRLAATALFLTLLWGAPASAQQGAPLPLEVDRIDLGAHPRVTAVITAPLELGGVPLDPGAVTVTEGGQARPVEVVHLSDERLEVVLVIDTSGSMRGAAFVAAKEAASAYITRLPANARVALVSFGSVPQLGSPLAEDRVALLNAVQGLVARGETALYDAVRLATEQFSGEADSRRSIIVLSDGGDTASTITVGDAAAAVTAAGAQLDVVELVTTESARSALDQLAVAGAGQVAPAGDPSALAGIYDRLAQSLVSEYTLTWESGAHASTPVTVRVDQAGVVAQRELQLEYPAAPVTTGPAPTQPTPRSFAEEPAPAPAPIAAWLLPTGAVCVAVALFIVGLNLFVPSGRRRRLARLGPLARSAAPKQNALSDLTGRAAVVAERALERNGRRGPLDKRLEQAGIPLRAGEYVVLALSAVVVAVVLGLLISGPGAALLLAVLAAAIAHLAPSVMRKRRRRAFSEQLGDTLQLLAGSLRAGYGLLQAIDALSKECSEPTNSEFRRLVVEMRMGRDLSEALTAMAERLDTEDFDWVVQAIEINREVGGDLAEVLDTVSSTIRERNQVLRQVKALTAEGRFSAYVLLALPFVLAGAMHLLNPDYMHLLTFGIGLVMTAVAGIMLFIGALWFRALCKLEY